MLTEAQRKERVGYIGASDAAAILGMSRWKSRLDVWAEKTGLVVPEDLSDKLQVELGNELEDFVARKFEKKTGKKVELAPKTVYFPGFPFIAANLDRRVMGENALLECKTTSAWKAREWEGEEIPQEYVIQVMHQLAVTGADKGYLAVLIGNQDFKVKEIERDEKAFQDLIKREVEFWEKFVVAKVPPAVSSMDQDTLAKMFPNAEAGKEIALDSAAAATCDLLESIRQDLASLERQEETQKNILRMALGDAEIGTVGPWRVKWKNIKTHRVDLDKLNEAVPDLLKIYQKVTESRRFTVDKFTKSMGA